jgi:Kdo2-lipid IVA lauroyltransferase/acyltransferase
MAPAALHRIERKFYTHLCDLSLEALMTGSMTGEEMQKRMVIRNPELINRFYEAGRSVVVVAMHYGSWEWLLHMPLTIRHHQFFVYKPLHNAGFDDYLNGLRGRFGGETIPMSIALRKLIEADKQKKLGMTWLAADQTPPWFNTFWTIYMNQEAPFFDGPAKIARRFNQPVIFQGVRKTGRGYYETWFEILVEEPMKLTEDEIVFSYVARMEEEIRKEPEWYIWSHRRWKHQRPADVPLRTAEIHK